MKKVLLFILMLATPLAVHGQVLVHGDNVNDAAFIFRFAERDSVIIWDSTCMEARRLAARLDSARRTGMDVNVFAEIKTYSSPDGATQPNIDFSKARARKTAEFISKTFKTDSLSVEAVGEDWTGLKTAVIDGKYPFADDVIDIIDNVPEFIRDANGKITDGRKHRLMTYGGGKAYKIIKKEIYPNLRRAEVKILYYTIKAETLSAIPVPHATGTESATSAPAEQDPTARPAAGGGADTMKTASQRQILLAPRTNLLIPGMNAGMSVPITRNISVEADFYSPWIGFSADNERCFQVQAADIEVRWWFGQRNDKGFKGNSLTGHSLAVGAFGGHYDFEKDFNGVRGEGYGGYIDYSYFFRLADHLRLQLGLSVGYARIPWRTYTVYAPGGKLIYDGYIQNYTEWIGPLKAQIGLVVPITVKR